MDWKDRAEQLKTDVPALWLCLREKETPLLAKVLAALTLRCIPKETFERCRGEAAGMWADGKPKRWYYALPILVLWVLAAIFLVKLVLHLL